MALLEPTFITELRCRTTLPKSDPPSIHAHLFISVYILICTSVRREASGRSMLFDPEKLERAAYIVVILIVISLPWSTSATAILAVIWLCLLLPALSPSAFLREITTPAGGLPVLLVLLAVAGIIWSSAPLAARLSGLTPFVKLLAIPLLFAQFRRISDSSKVLVAFLGSCVALLATSFLWIAWRQVPLPPSLPRPAFLFTHDIGVPVKDYIAQSGEFVICIAALLMLSIYWAKQRRYVLLLLSAALIAGFLANISYVITSKTSLVVLPMLFALFAIKYFRPGNAVLLVLAGTIVAIGLLTTSSYLWRRASVVLPNIQAYITRDADSSSAERLVYWTKAIKFVREAPVIGHGTGTIYQLYKNDATGQGLLDDTTTNPHNQTAAVAIQLGLLGAAILWAMWLSHLWMLRGPTIAAWMGLAIAAQNVVSSAFNSHLFDFSQGWLYVLGVGIAGGIVRRSQESNVATKSLIQSETK